MSLKVKYSFTTFAAKHYLVKTTQERNKLLNKEIQFTHFNIFRISSDIIGIVQICSCIWKNELNNKLTVKCTQICTFWAPFSVNFIHNLSPQINVKYSMIFHWPSNMMAKCHFFISSGGSSSYFAIPQPPLIFFSKKLGFLQELLCHCPHKHSPPNF